MMDIDDLDILDQDLDDAWGQLDAARETVGNDQASSLRWQVHVEPHAARVCGLMALKIGHHQELKAELDARAAASTAELAEARERLMIIQGLRRRQAAGEEITRDMLPR